MNWTEGLNLEQQKAVLHDHGPLLILAGAGSGKTTVLVSRTGRLIEDHIANPKEICVLTFTNKSANELKHRVTAKLGQSANGVWAGTFHSFGLLILKQFYKEAGLPKYFGILDGSDQQGVAKDLLRQMKYAEKMDFDVMKLLAVLSDWRSQGITSGSSENHYHIAAEWLLPKYEKRLEQLGAVDFDDLLLKPLRLFEAHPAIHARIQSAFSQVMVDEFQDTNRVQMRLVQSLVEKHNNIAVVGDDDQSIYGWRGAQVENILRFPTSFKNCKVIKLEENYRSTPAILNLANSVIAKNEKRHAKILKSSKQEAGEQPELFIFENEDEELERTVTQIRELIEKGTTVPDEVAILYRSNSQGALFEAECKRQQVPHQVTGSMSFFERKEIKDVMAYLICSQRPHEISLRRIINNPPRGIGETTVETLHQWGKLNDQSFVVALNNWRKIEIPEATGGKIEGFLESLKTLHTHLVDAARTNTTAQVLTDYFTEIGYKAHLQKSFKEPAQFQQRWQLVEIFGNILDKFFARGGRTSKTIREFIEAMTLRDDDDRDEEKKPTIKLLTLHACKGLEFDHVFLTAVEEDILPHKTLGSDVSEERRLFYVGVTRARKHLTLSYARARKRYGKLTSSAPSRFLLEIPKNLYKEFALGWRPVSNDQRKSMLADLFKKIDSIESI